MNRKIATSVILTLSLISTFKAPLIATTVDSIEGDVADVNNKIEENNSTIEAKKAEIEKLNQEVESSEAELNNLREQIEENQDKIDSINEKITTKETEIEDLNEKLAVKKNEASQILINLQHNANINIMLSVMADDSIDGVNKIRAVQGLNKLSGSSMTTINQTIALSDKVNVERDNLKSQKADLETEQQTLANQSADLVAQSQEQAQKKEQILTDVTSLENTSSDLKNQLLTQTNLLDKYESAGCTGDDVYGVDCAVPQPKIDQEREKAQDEVEVKQSETEKKPDTNNNSNDNNNSSSNNNSSNNNNSNNNSGSNNSGGSYYAKLKSNPDANYIINKESGWNPYATNPNSGAYGICQALPGSKMASAGSDWATNIETQSKWCDGYVNSRYGSWSAARAHWDSAGWF